MLVNTNRKGVHYMNTSEAYKSCNLCARECGVDRTAGDLGYCSSPDVPMVTRASLHMWEEPIISGTQGSGTIFFSGCSLGCVYCQNRQISRGAVGLRVNEEHLANIMLDLENRGAHNVNFVTPTHYAPSVRAGTRIARSRGFKLPIVYNTGGYDTVSTIKMLDGYVDVYLPDFKYIRSSSARDLSFAPDYPEVARAAIAEMHRQCPEPIIRDGLIKSGVVVRVLLLPMHVAEAKLAVKYLFNEYGDSIYISLMNQYTPMPDMMPPLDRRVTVGEYNELVDYAMRIGVKNAFIQEEGTQSESFIPEFDGSGVID